jgi:septal ring factor EnvC (AmiA/AmiB activator)
MKMIAVAIAAVIAAVAGAGFAWQRNQALEKTKAELASTNSQMQKAKDDMLAMRVETEALRKEFAEQKLAAERSRADLASAQSYLDAEKAVGARLREELLKTKEQLASAGRPRSAQAAQVNPGAPTVRMVPTQPMVIKRSDPSGKAAIQASPPGPAAGYGAPAK